MCYTIYSNIKSENEILCESVLMVISAELSIGLNFSFYSFMSAKKIVRQAAVAYQISFDVRASL